MKRVFVIAYYGSVYSKQFTHNGWKDTYIGEGIVHTSREFEHHFMLPQIENLIKKFAPEKYSYAMIEERYYPVGE